MLMRNQVDPTTLASLDYDALIQIPGIGPATARDILDQDAKRAGQVDPDPANRPKLDFQRRDEEYDRPSPTIGSENPELDMVTSQLLEEILPARKYDLFQGLCRQSDLPPALALKKIILGWFGGEQVPVTLLHGNRR